MRFVSDSLKSGKPEPREVEQASVRFHASFINRFTFINKSLTSRLREPIGNRESRNTKMEKKEKKIYQSPTMTVYEISRTQILAGSTNGGTETLDEEEYRW